MTMVTPVHLAGGSEPRLGHYQESPFLNSFCLTGDTSLSNNSQSV